MYRNEKAGANFIDSISTSIFQKLLINIKKCNFFNLLKDQTINSSATEKELIYILFLDVKEHHQKSL